MSNHYHLEPEAEGTPLARMMHDLDGTYASIYNARHGGCGALFQGRFKSIAILDEDGLIYVSRYIHANPMALGIRPEDYRWSSCRNYLGEAPPPEWLDTAPILSLIGASPEQQFPGYRAYLQAAPPPRTANDRMNDDRLEFYKEYIVHLEQRCSDAIDEVGGDLRLVSPETVFLWIARRRYGIPCAILSDQYGRRAATVRTMVSRFGKLLERDSRVLTAVDQVYERVARFR
jgi:hypothetical protein